MNRTEERQVAFEIIFSFPFNQTKAIDQIICDYYQHEESVTLTDYIKDTVYGVFDNISAIDDQIKNNIKTRKFERLDNVCLAVLRLGVFEMFYNDDIPANVAINEAIELIKKYDDSLSSFVHGNLAVIYKNNNE